MISLPHQFKMDDLKSLILHPHDTPQDHVMHKMVGDGGNFTTVMEYGDPGRNYDFHLPRVRNVYHTNMALPTTVTKVASQESEDLPLNWF